MAFGCFSSLMGKCKHHFDAEAPPAYVSGPRPPASVSATKLRSVIGNHHPDYYPAVKAAEQAIDGASGDLRTLSMAIHDDPELAYEEHHTHDRLVAFMRKQKGWIVTPHAYGLDTAWEAVYEHGKGGRTIGLQSEMDALPGVGHAWSVWRIDVC